MRVFQVFWGVCELLGLFGLLSIWGLKGLWGPLGLWCLWGLCLIPRGGIHRGGRPWDAYTSYNLVWKIWHSRNFTQNSSIYCYEIFADFGQSVVEFWSLFNSTRQVFSVTKLGWTSLFWPFFVEFSMTLRYLCYQGLHSDI